MKQKVFLFLFLSLFSTVAFSEEPKEPSLLDSAWNIAKGAGQCVGDMVCEPFRMIHDDGMAIYFMMTDQKDAARAWVMNGEAKSNFSKAVHAYNFNHMEDSFLEKTVGFTADMGKGLVMMPWDMKEAWDEGDYEKVGYLGTSILSITVPAAYGLRNVSITFPRNSIQFIPVSVGENQFALAAISTRVITIEGVSITEGTTLGIFEYLISETNGSIGAENTAGTPEGRTGHNADRLDGEEGGLVDEFNERVHVEEASANTEIGRKGGWSTKDPAARNNMRQVEAKVREFREKESTGTFKPGEKEQILNELEEMLGHKKADMAPKSPQKPKPSFGHSDLFGHTDI